MSQFIGYGRQYVDPDDVQAVVRVLHSSHLTQGPEARAFEDELCEVTGATHALAVSNGTVALQVAYAGLGLRSGSKLVTSPNTFLATATAAVLAGAEVEFVDIDPRSGNLDVDRLGARLAAGRVPDVVTAVHFAGLPCDMERLLALKRAYGFKFVEDAAHALGARYLADGRWWRVGEHPEVDVTCFSFHPVKHITTGEGGAVLSHDDELAERMRLLSEHGVDRDADASGTTMVALGMNGRMNELSAALGRSQLTKLDRFLAERARIADRYHRELGPLVAEGTLELMAGSDDERSHAWHLFVVRVATELGPVDRDSLRAHLRAAEVGTQVHYRPVPRQPWFEQNHPSPAVHDAEAYAERCLSLPIFPGLTDLEQTRVIEACMSWRARGTRAA